MSKPSSNTDKIAKIIKQQNLTPEEKKVWEKELENASIYDHYGADMDISKLEKKLKPELEKAQKQATDRMIGEQSEESRLARIAAANEENVARNAAYQAARNSGANRVASSAIAGANTPMGSQSQMQSAMRNAANSTQADYLSKMGYANALDLQSKNLEKGAFLNTMSSIFGGAGQGAETGASIGGL